MNPLTVQSKLPDVGTTIFTVMTAMARECNADNLAQGFPEFDPDPYLQARVNHYVLSGANQYAPMTGVPELREAIKDKVSYIYDTDIDAESEITVTSGATEAIYAAIQAVVSQGNEVIVFDPSYDSYDPAIRLAGGKAVHIALTAGDFRIDWDELERRFNHRPIRSSLAEPNSVQIWIKPSVQSRISSPQHTPG